MKKHVYTAIALFSFAGPFALSFDEKVHFISYAPAVALATLVIGAVYIFWDILVTRAGHWRFNDETVGSLRILHLPLGEWLFFGLIPYACIFIYEVISAYFGPGTAIPGLWYFQLAIGLMLIPVVWLVRRRGYSALAIASVSVFMLVSAILTPGMFAASGYGISMGLIFAAFIVIDGLYTSIPTIYYNPSSVSGLRLGSIPAEDFLYNLSYIGLTLAVYDAAKQMFQL